MIVAPRVNFTASGWRRFPARYQKPTTRWGRSVPRRFHHEPINSTLCACGDILPDRERFLKHLRAFMPAWWRVRFQPARGGEKVAAPLIGHRLSYKPSPERHWGQVRCSCGWRSTSRRIRQPGPVAREHVRAIVQQRLTIPPPSPEAIRASILAQLRTLQPPARLPIRRPSTG